MMRRKYVAITMGVMLGIASITGCSKNDTASEAPADSAASEASVVSVESAASVEPAAQMNAENAIYGEVSKIEDSIITIKVGTMNGRGRGTMPEQSEESITIDDIAIGDIVSITLDDSGAAAKITVMSMKMENNKTEK